MAACDFYPLGRMKCGGVAYPVYVCRKFPGDYIKNLDLFIVRWEKQGYNHRRGQWKGEICHAGSKYALNLCKREPGRNYGTCQEGKPYEGNAWAERNLRKSIDEWIEMHYYSIVGYTILRRESL